MSKFIEVTNCILEKFLVDVSGAIIKQYIPSKDTEAIKLAYGWITIPSTTIIFNGGNIGIDKYHIIETYDQIKAMLM